MPDWGTSIARLRAHGAIRGDERKLAGLVSGMLYILAGLTSATMALLPGIPHGHQAVVLGIAALATAVGIHGLLAVDWSRLPVWVTHLSLLVVLAAIAVGVASTGGPTSPAWVFVLFPAFFACYFYGRSVTVLYLLACVLVQSLPLLYDPYAVHDGFLAQLVTAASAYFAVPLVINDGKRRGSAMRDSAQKM